MSLKRLAAVLVVVLLVAGVTGALPLIARVVVELIGGLFSLVWWLVVNLWFWSLVVLGLVLLVRRVVRQVSVSAPRGVAQTRIRGATSDVTTATSGATGGRPVDEDPQRPRADHVRRGADLQERSGADSLAVPRSGGTFREQAVAEEAQARLAVIRAAGLLNRTARQADREVVVETYGDILETAEQLTTWCTIRPSRTRQDSLRRVGH